MHEAVAFFEQACLKDAVPLAIQLDQQPWTPFLDHEQMPGTCVDGYLLQPFVVRRIRELARNAGVVGHRRSRSTHLLTSTDDVDGDRRIGLLLDGT